MTAPASPSTPKSPTGLAVQGSREPLTVDTPRRERMILSAMFFVVLLVFGRSVGFEFVNWDDADNLYHNTLFNPPTWDGLKFFWTHSYKYFYLPVTYTVWWLLAHPAQLSVPDPDGGHLNPLVFHLANVLLHAVNVTLVWQIVRRVVRDDWMAAAGALVWGLHPLKAEPVAWATGMKDVLSGLLALIAILQFQRAMRCGDGRRSWLRVAGGAVVYLAAMLAKPTMVVALPVAAVLSLWEDPGRWRSVLRGAAVWLAVAVPVVALAVYFSKTTAPFTYPLWQRPLVAGDTAAFYLGKAVFPWPLATMYGRSPQAVYESGAIYWTWTIPATVLVLAVLVRRRAPWALASVLVFLLAVAPASGIEPFKFQNMSTVADRYSYVPLLGLATAAAAVGAELAARPGRRKAVLGGASVLVTALGGACFVQVGTWRDSLALSTHLLKVNDVPFARSMHAVNLENHGRRDEAVVVLRGLVRDDPESLVARIDLAQALGEMGRHEEAVAESRAAAAIYLRYPERIPLLTLPSQARLGVALKRAGALDRVMSAVRPQLERAPRDVENRVYVAMLLLGGGYAAEAEQLLDEAEAIGTNPELVTDAGRVLRTAVERGAAGAGGR